MRYQKVNEMSGRTEKAINYHKSFCSCSESVLCAFCDTAGISEKDAKKAAVPFAGGKMGKCGAVLAAEYIIDKKYGEEAEKIKSLFEEQFIQMNRSVNCAELKGRLTGKPLRSCRGCVSDAADLLEKIIDNG